MSGSSGTLLGGLLLGVLCGAGIGAGVTYMVFSTGTGAAEAQGPVHTGEPPAPPARGATSDESTGPGLPEVAVARTEGEAPLPGAPQDLLASVEGMLAGAPRPRPVAGTGRIHGTVRDPQGNPVAGVTIRARRNRPSTGGSSSRGQGPPARQSLEERVQRSVEAWYREQAELQEAVSGADGSYELTRLLSGDYRLDAWLEGATVSSEGRYWDVEVGSRLDFTARILHEVPAVVRLPGGDPAPAATLEVSEFVGDSQSRSNHGWTPEQPVLRLPAGRFEVKATHQVGSGRTAQEMVSEVESFLVEPGQAPPALELRLQGRLGIRGRVLPAEGEPLDSAVVCVLPLAAGQEADLSLLAKSDLNSWIGGRDPDYEFLDLAPGRYVVGVARNWRQRVVTHAVLDVRDQVVFQDLEVPPLDASECLVVRATGPDGEPVRDLDFSLDWRRNNSSTGTGADGVLKANDTWWVMLPEEGLRVLHSRWDSGTSFILELRSDRYGSKRVPLSQGQRAVQVRFVDPGILTVRVPGYHGSGYEGLLKVRVELDEGDRRSTVGQTSPWTQDGTVEVKPIEPGDYDVLLELSASGQSYSRNEIARLPVTVRAGPQEVALAIPALYELRVKVPDGAAGGDLTLQDMSGRTQRSAELDDQGVAVFPHVAAGTWQLQYFGAGMPGWMTVEVPASGLVVFESQPVNALRCRITDPAGSLAQAGLQDEDLVIAVDGKEFTNIMELQGLFMTLMSKESVEFTVLRGGGTLTVRVDGRKLMSAPQDMGGEFMPATR